MKPKGLAAVALLAFAISSYANEVPVNVRGCFISVPTTFDRVGDASLGQSEIYGVAESLPAGRQWDGTTHSCRSVWTKTDAGYEFANRCANVDGDGDRFITMATGTSPKSFKWAYIAGTGKYKGIRGGGTGRFEEVYPEESMACWRGEGAYTIKN